jgi:glutamate-ammonia-ligase adenylyltransferase
VNIASADAMNSFCILAFGKLGGRELNYSSDIDLLSIYDVDQSSDGDLFYRAIGQVGNYLSSHTAEGHAYRVDFRLRPYGRAGQLAYSLKALTEYYRKNAALWEIQALLKARPIAGSEKLGQSFIEMVGNIMREKKGCKEIIASIATMRDTAIKAGGENGRIDADIKNGSGGIRDIEFIVQGLQLFNCPLIPELISGNTLDALTLLGKHNLMPPEAVEQLKSDYEFLRRVEHCLQIFEDQQVHVLPDSDEERLALAKRVLGFKATADELLKEMISCQTRVRYMTSKLTAMAEQAPRGLR